MPPFRQSIAVMHTVHSNFADFRAIKSHAQGVRLVKLYIIFCSMFVPLSNILNSWTIFFKPPRLADFYFVFDQIPRHTKLLIRS